MSKILQCFLAVSLVLSPLAATAQDEIDKSDMMGQEPPSASPMPQVAPRRVVISNVEDRSVSEPLRNLESDVGRPDRTRLPSDALGASQAKDRDDRRKQGKSAPSEFQKFLQDRSGHILPVFGSGFFANGGATYTPIVNSPLPADYLLGPGDELMIRGSGSIDIDYRAKIDRNGTISIPTVGTIVLAGVRAGSAESVVRGAIGRLYKGVTVNVNFGQLRAITIYVVGQAMRPGTYTVSSMSTLVTALFASGGPNANGSIRRVQVNRGGKVVAELDLYAFLAKGDKSSDIKLMDGDSIYLPSVVGYAALVGKVNTPAIYELKSNADTIEALLDIAGGLPVVADPRRAFLERIDPSRSQPRSVEQFALNSEGLKHTLKNGDVLNITSITPDFSNAVVLRGNVDQAVRAPYRSGMRVSDLIPNREYLVTRESLKRQNGALNAGESEKIAVQPEVAAQPAENIAARIGGAIDQINWEYAVIERINRLDLSVNLIPFNLGKVFTDPAGADNVLLQAGDTVTVFSQQDVAVPRDRRRVIVRIEGEINVPGVYQMAAGDTLQSLLARAGGPTHNAYLFGTAFYREEARAQQILNLEKVARRLDDQLRGEQSRIAANQRSLSPTDAQSIESQRQASVVLAKEALQRLRALKPTGRLSLGLNLHDQGFAHLPQLRLENGDRLVIPSRPDFVHVFGAVNSESSPIWRSNMRVSDYLRSAGVTADADVDNAFILRVDGSGVSRDSGGWLFGKVSSMEVMPGDSIVIPEKLDRESAWAKFTTGTREWAQIFANFGLGAAAIKTLKN